MPSSSQRKRLAAAGGASPADPESEPGDFPFLAPAESPDEVGWLAHYRVLRLCGEGGMGYVFQAEDTQLQRLVALKVMKPDRGDDEGARMRFLREARATAALKNDRIVTIYQVGQDRDVCFLAMEWLEGEPLDRLLKRGTRLPIPEIVRVGREIAEGLSAAHARGLIHRDIKPGNIWLETKGGQVAAGQGFHVKLLDFGLARVVHDDVRLTQQGFIVGTPAYMAPEQAHGTECDARLDLYSLGVVLYELCGGRLPFEGETTMAVLLALTQKDPPALLTLNPQVPQPLAELIHQMLAKEPQFRPASAVEVIETLDRLQPQRHVPLAEAIQSGTLPLALPVPTALAQPWSGNAAAPLAVTEAITSLPEVHRPVSPRRPLRLRTALLAGAGGLVLTLILGLVYILAFSPKPQRATGVSAVVATIPATVREEDGWVKRVASLPTPQQLDLIVKEFRKESPGFDGELKPVVEQGVVVGLTVPTQLLTDLRPPWDFGVRAKVDLWVPRVRCATLGFVM